MVILVRILGVVVTLAGVLFLVKPGMLKQMIEFIIQGKRVYAVGVVRIIIGIIFLLAASQCRLVWLIIVLGIIILVAGIMVLTLGVEKCHKVINTVKGKPDNVIRLIALIPVLIGVLVLFAA